MLKIKLASIVFFLIICKFSVGQMVSTLVSEFPGDGELSFDSLGNIYVNDSGENGILNGDKVYKVTTTGDTSLFHSNLPIWVVGSIFDPNGNLLVTGWQAGKISRISPDGTVSTNVASGINGAGSLEIDEFGNIYVAEYITSKVLKFDTNGNIDSNYIVQGNPIYNPAGLAYAQATKKLYVSNWTNNKICVIDSNQVTTEFAQIPDPSVGPIKIFGGYLFATSPQYHKIYKINLQDSTDVQLFAGTGTLGNTDGDISTATFNTPTGIGTLDGETFYIAETFGGTGRLRVIEGVALNQNEEQNGKTSKFSLNLKTYPNPFNPNTTIEFELIEKSKVEVDIFNILGKKIKVLVEGKYSKGIQKLNWNGRNEDGNLVSSGVYLVKIRTKNEIQIKKILYLK